MDLHLDFETYSEADLKKVGLVNYARHPSTEVTLTAWAVDREPVEQREGATALLRTFAGRSDVVFHAFNAPFERIIMREVLDIEVPIERWRCTMVHAYSLGFSGGLAQVGQQLGLPEDKAKLDRGRRLIQKFCKPAPKNHLVDRYTKNNAPEDWEEFKLYNRQDVVAERELEMLFAPYPLPESELQLWFADQRINDRGLPTDPKLIEAAIEVYHAERRHLRHQLGELTHLENANSVSQLLEWLHRHGVDVQDLKAETVEKTIKELTPAWGSLPNTPLQVLKLRQQLARTAGAKWEAFKRMADENDHRIRHVFQFHGAQRTARWAGRGIQPHNLHRSPSDQDEKVRALELGDRNWVEALYG